MQSEDQKIEAVKEKYRTGMVQPGSGYSLPAEVLMRSVPCKVQKVAGCIHENIFNPELTIKWIEQECGMGRDIFYPKFRELLGISPKRFIVNHRIRAAKKLLIETGCSFLTAALAVGFAGQSPFNNAFRRTTNTTPAKWLNDVKFQKI